LVSLKENPGLDFIGTMLFAVFSADVAELQHTFEFTRAELNKQTGHWEVSLSPKDAMIRKVIDHIDLSGDRVLDKLRFYEVNGDDTLIVFSGVSENQPLPKDEEALFE
jgi:hypothetical protein